MNRRIRVIAPLVVLVACNAVDAPPAVEESDHPIDQVFAGLGTLPVEPPRRIEGPPSAPIADGDFQCVDRSVDEVRQLDQLLGQLSTGDVLWPGSMLRGESVYTGQLAPLGFERAPLTFSVSLESLGDRTRSATMTTPSLSSYRDAIGPLLAQELTGSIPARIYAEIEEVSSEAQLAGALGMSASAPLVGMIKGGFDFTSTKKRSRFVVKFFQLYYTVDVDPPHLPHQFFGASVTADEISASIGDNPPVYVSSIGYGRQVIFTFESELATSELEAALDFAYHGGVMIDGRASLTHQEVLANTHTTAFILGGDAGAAASASVGDYDQLREFIANGGNYSKDSPGAAIAYKLSYVRDNTPVLLSYASTYTQRTCARVTQKLHVVLERLTVDSAGSDSGGDLEIFGAVSARGSAAVPLVSWSAQNYRQIAAGHSFPTTGIIAEAIVPVMPQPGNDVTLSTSLLEADGVINDSFGDAVEDRAPFEGGWRRSVEVHRASGAQAITLRFSITPVP